MRGDKCDKNSGSLLPLHSVTSVPHQVKCIIAYDGARYNGFQAQKSSLDTIQEKIESAIRRTTGEVIRIVGSSRTDKGVHALGQVIVFRTRCSANATELRNALNTRLPDDIACNKLVYLSPEDPVFNPRKDSIGKLYEYRIVCGGIRPVHARKAVWFIKSTLDIPRMEEAAKHFYEPPNAKNYSSFTPNPSIDENENECIIHTLSIFVDNNCSEYQDEDDEQIWLRIRVHGDRFLYKMVRNLVGTLVDIGAHKMEPDAIPSVLQGRNRRLAGQGAPSQGLTLLRVYFL